MKLSQRIDWILLPIITLFFSLAAWLALEAAEDLAGDYLQRRLDIELHGFNNDLLHRQHLLQSNLDQILNSQELIDFVNRNHSVVQNLALQDLIERARVKASTVLPSLHAIQILDAQGKLLVSASGTDPFVEQEAEHIPADMQWWVNKSTITPSQSRPFIKRGEGNSLLLGAIQPFSHQLLMLDDLRKVEPERLLYATITLEIYEERELIGRLRNELGMDYQLLIEPVGEQGVAINRLQANNTGSERQIQAVSQTDLYTATLSLPWSAISQAVLELYPVAAFITVILTLLSYLFIRILIDYQVIKPVLKLTNKVEIARKLRSDRLEALPSNDEIAILNNAYVELISDVHRLASYDSLTGLANRRSFLFSLEQCLAQCTEKNHQLALLYIDLDNFKQVNDTHGHDMGDKVLCEFSLCIQSLVRKTDSIYQLRNKQVARLAGDEFAIILNDIPHIGAVRNIACRLLQIFEDGFEVNGITHDVNASIGIAMAPSDGLDSTTLIHNADAAMYCSKQEGKGKFTFFSQSIARQLEERMSIENALRQSIQSEGSFYLVFMPVFETVSRKIVGAEVLLRCDHPLLNEVGPEKFIPVAESSGLIKQIDLWVINSALKSLSELQAEYGDGIRIYINFSALELHNDVFPESVKQLIDCYQIEPNLIEMEVTETSLIDNDQQSIDVLRRLKAIGVTVALDDFGTGYTAFNQLNSYPVDTLKIDRSFISLLNRSNLEKRPMADIIVELARIFELQTVAEGVETLEQLELVTEFGCHYAQGYYLSKPVPLTTFKTLLTSSRQRLQLNA
ncbi:EAL domain-containing protein [Photobacterium sp. SDRW27]|uniref:putative bifunctional diguanylate cyclase/phosphodiesterase n=1 Tax=Photobacterium obscurum TaxID=2829490 RepID=UPI0022432BBA|nr:EAL domain-containing protein [Photobacterium obscurum]MCW8327615.1 EAL domain-containing protein [Photobacterium obscurum]